MCTQNLFIIWLLFSISSFGRSQITNNLVRFSWMGKKLRRNSICFPFSILNSHFHIYCRHRTLNTFQTSFFRIFYYYLFIFSFHNSFLFRPLWFRWRYREALHICFSHFDFLVFNKLYHLIITFTHLYQNKSNEFKIYRIIFKKKKKKLFSVLCALKINAMSTINQ